LGKEINDSFPVFCIPNILLGMDFDTIHIFAALLVLASQLDYKSQPDLEHQFALWSKSFLWPKLQN